MFGSSRSRPDLAPTASAAPLAAAIAAPEQERRRDALRFMASALRSGLVQLADTGEAVGQIVRSVAEADLEPLAGRPWELLARRAQSALAEDLGEHLDAIGRLKDANQHVQSALALMAEHHALLEERTCQLAEDTVRAHLEACARRLTRVAEVVRQMRVADSGPLSQAA